MEGRDRDGTEMELSETARIIVNKEQKFRCSGKSFLRYCLY
jgi:hypothetical protein